MLNWFRSLVGRSPRLIEAEHKLVELNNRVDALVDRVTIDGEEKWMLKLERAESFPQVFQCREVDENES